MFIQRNLTILHFLSRGVPQKQIARVLTHYSGLKDGKYLQISTSGQRGSVYEMTPCWYSSSCPLAKAVTCWYQIRLYLKLTPIELKNSFIIIGWTFWNFYLHEHYWLLDTVTVQSFLPTNPGLLLFAIFFSILAWTGCMPIHDHLYLKG